MNEEGLEEGRAVWRRGRPALSWGEGLALEPGGGTSAQIPAPPLPAAPPGGGSRSVGAVTGGCQGADLDFATAG